MPAPTGVIRASAVDILIAISDRLLAKNVVVDASRIIFTVRPTFPHFGADKDIVIRPYGFSVNQNQVDAAGRVATIADRHITTICRTRLHLDEAHRDKVWLLNETRGHLAFEEATVDALHLFWPTDADGNELLVEPMRLMRVDTVIKDAKDAAWGQSAMDWQIQYLLNLDQADQ